MKGAGPAQVVKPSSNVYIFDKINKEKLQAVGSKSKRNLNLMDMIAI